MKNPIYILLFVLLSCVNTFAQKVKIHTTEGVIVLQLYGDKAPITVNNFLKLVQSDFYKNGSFYRVVRTDNQIPEKPKIEVIQGGAGFGSDSTYAGTPIELERTSLTGIKHVNGAISMARFKPNSATSEFFICINDQPTLDFGGARNPDGQGFAAFGVVIKGMKVVRKIQSGKTTLMPRLDLPQKLIEPVRIIKVSVVN